MPKNATRAAALFRFGCEKGSDEACTAVQRGYASGVDERAESAPPPRPREPVDARKILLFGGKGHKAYLGCVVCDTEDSVFNDRGEFGKNGISLSGATLWGTLSEYRSMFSEFSACNRIAGDPPVVVYSDGEYVGRLTLNLARADAIKNEKIVNWLQSEVCSR